MRWNQRYSMIGYVISLFVMISMELGVGMAEFSDCKRVLDSGDIRG